MQPDNNKRLKIILAFAAVYIIWGTTYLFIRLAIETIPPFFMAGARFILAGAIIYLFLHARGVPPPPRIQWRSAVIVGTLMLAGGSGLVHWAEQTIPISIAALVIATVPLWITLFDWLIFRNSRPGKKATAGLLLGFLGIILLIGPDQITGAADFSWTALLILMLAPIFWSIGSLHSRQANLPQNNIMASGMEMLAGGVVMLFAGLLTGEVSRFDLTAISTLSWLSFLFLIFFGSIITFTAYTYLLKTVSASKAASYSYVNPIIAVFLGGLILNEPITPTMIAAMVIIVVAVFLIISRQSPQSLSNLESSEPDRSPASETDQPSLVPPMQ